MSGSLTALCTGPVGPHYVQNLTVTANTSTSCYSPATGTVVSMCNGYNTTQLWWYSTSRATLMTPTTCLPSSGSWLYAPAPSNIFTLEWPAIQFTPPLKRPRILPGVIRAGRRAVRRSIAIYAGLRGMDEIRRFIAGEPIELVGHLYDYRMQKRGSIVQQTMNPGSVHIPYQLNLIEKGTRKVLSSGCVVFRNLPVIDQMLSLAFHLQNVDDEIRLLDTTNWSPGIRRRRQHESGLLLAA